MWSQVVHFLVWARHGPVLPALSGAPDVPCMPGVPDVPLVPAVPGVAGAWAVFGTFYLMNYVVYDCVVSINHRFRLKYVHLSSLL